MSNCDNSAPFDVDSWAAIASAVILGTLGVLSFIIQPALVQGFVSHLGLTEPEALNLAGIEMLGVAAATIALALPGQQQQYLGRTVDCGHRTRRNHFAELLICGTHAKG